MTQAARPAPCFVGESPALDCLNSVAIPRSVRYDWLETGPDLLDWLVAVGLASQAELAPFRKPTAAPALEEARQEIVAFGERFRPFIEEVCGSVLTDAGHPVIAEINRVLARGGRFLQIARAPDTDAPTSGPIALVDRRPLTDPRDLIVRIATAAARLFAEADFRHVRNCEGPTCRHFFRRQQEPQAALVLDGGLRQQGQGRRLSQALTGARTPPPVFFRLSLSRSAAQLPLP